MQPFDLIWNQLPEWQNRHSSTWWFFLLSPRQAEGYGPKQMMFSLATRAGNPIAINGVPQPGLDLRRPTNGAREQFNTMAVGWVHDGNRMHDNLVNQPVVATLAREGLVGGWAETADGRCHGGELRAEPSLPSGINAHFVGEGGSARFTVWADDPARLTSPAETVKLRTPFGGCNSIGWQRLSFRGEFDYPGCRESLEGIGYFQRVCLNFPTFPWKWIWAAFEDKSIFSGFVPYIGLNLLRRGDWFFPHRLEKMALPIKVSSYFAWGDSLAVVQFDRIRVALTSLDREFPEFMVECRSAAGDVLRYRIEPYGHARLTLDRRLLGGLWRSGFNYNEYMFRIRDLTGQVGGRPVNSSTVGNGFGNIEYTWGLGV
jgi:hypothetical protein